MTRKLSPTTQKIILLLSAGVILGFSTSPARYFKILKAVAQNWKDINEEELKRAIRRLYKSKMISLKENTDGSETMVTITPKGKQKTLTFKIDKLSIKPMKKWDNKWRIVLFDVPEKYSRGRDALRQILKQLGFYEYQKSVFAHPFECQSEIDFVIEYFQLKPWVRFITADSLDNELHLKKYFKFL